jgi:hypothetical protein
MVSLYDEERKYLIPLGICLIVEYILFLIILRGLSYCKVIYPNLQDGKQFDNTINKYCARGGALFLTFYRVLIFLFLVFTLVHTHILNNSVEWNIYTSWSKYLATFYFLVVSFFSMRKVCCCEHADASQPLLDPRLSSLANSIFNMLVPVAFVASGVSGFMHRDVEIEDHVVTIVVLIEIILNTFRVGAGDVFLCISFSFLYISFVWVTSAFLQVSEWPHHQFKLKTKWCAVSYNVFIFAHFVSFILYYIFTKYVCFVPVLKAKVNPEEKEDSEFSTMPNSDENGDENAVIPFQDIESNINEPEPEPEPEPEKTPLLVTKAESDAELASLLGQMIAERTEKKRIIAEAEQLKLEVQELKLRNLRDHTKLEKVVGRLSERDLQLKKLEIWLSAKNDEELGNIKMAMAEKLNDMSHYHRPKSARGGELGMFGNTSALQDLDAKEPVQTKNLQALSALRKMKEKKYTKFDNVDTADDGDGEADVDGKRFEASKGSNFNMYQTL